MTIFEQMGNIYSEVGRSFKARDNNDLSSSQAAMHRAIDLFDATAINLAENKSPKLKEVLRAKDQYLTILNDAKSSKETVNSLDKYFMQFAVAARLHR